MTSGNIYTIAGTSGTLGNGGDGAPLTSALNYPYGVFVDSAGNVFIADTDNNRVRMIAKYNETNYGIVNMAANNIYTIASSGGPITDGIAPISSALTNPRSVCVDSAGNVFIASTAGHIVRMVASKGAVIAKPLLLNNIYTIAGTGTLGTGANGTPLSSALNYPYGVCVDSLGNVFISDTSNHRIRMIAKTGGTNYGVIMTANNIYTIAGTGSQGIGGEGIAPLTSELVYPYGVFVDSVGNVFIADIFNHRVRMIAKIGGTNYGVVMTAGNIYTIAGTSATVSTGGVGGEGVAPTNSALKHPSDVYVDSLGNVFIADSSNHRVRMIAKTGGTNYGVVMTAGNIYTIAGTSATVANGGVGGEGVAPTNSALKNPYSLCVDSLGNVFIADFINHRVRMIAKIGGTNYGVVMTAGNIYTIAGTSATVSTGGVGGEGVAPTNSALKNPAGVCVDSVGNVFIADYQNNRVRMIAKTGGTNYGVVMTAGNIYTIASGSTPGTQGIGGDGSPLSSAFHLPRSVCVDSLGNVFITDYNNHRVRMIVNSIETNYYYTNNNNTQYFDKNSNTQYFDKNSGYLIKNVDAFNYNSLLYTVASS
jgi:hypothetical protein